MTRYLSIAEYLWLAEQVTGIQAEELSRSARVELADSALHAPQASFGGTDFYPDLMDKAAVLAGSSTVAPSVPQAAPEPQELDEQAVEAGPLSNNESVVDWAARRPISTASLVVVAAADMR